MTGELGTREAGGWEVHRAVLPPLGSAWRIAIQQREEGEDGLWRCLFRGYDLGCTVTPLRLDVEAITPRTLECECLC